MIKTYSLRNMNYLATVYTTCTDGLDDIYTEKVSNVKCRLEKTRVRYISNIDDIDPSNSVSILIDPNVSVIAIDDKVTVVDPDGTEVLKDFRVENVATIRDITGNYIIHYSLTGSN